MNGARRYEGFDGSNWSPMFRNPNVNRETQQSGGDTCRRHASDTSTMGHT